MLRNQPLQLLGTCNGLLLCILNGKELFLLNPTTRVMNKILHLLFKQDDAFVFYGLGYDSSSDFDYKVVRGVCNYEYLSGERRDIAEIYSRNSESRKRIENFPYKDIVQVSGVLVEGALHWLVIVETGVNGGLFYAIGSLDLGEEKFREVSLPEDCGEGNYNVHLGALDGFS